MTSYRNGPDIIMPINIFPRLHKDQATTVWAKRTVDAEWLPTMGTPVIQPVIDGRI